MLERIPISTHWETTSGSKSKLTWLPQEPYSIQNAIYIYIYILTNESPLFSKQYILNPRVPELSEHTHKYTHMCNSCCLPPVLDHSQLITHVFSSSLSVTLFCLSFSYVPLLKLHPHTLCLLCLVRNVRTCAL